MYYHPFSSSSRSQHNHPNFYPSFSHYHNQSIYYTPYYNVHYPNRQGRKRVHVWLWGITCIQDGGYGEGGHVQIYGTLGANNTILWSKDAINYIDIPSGNLYPTQVTKEIVLEEGQHLKLHGHLWEHDILSSDDDMGVREVNISYYDIKNDWVEYKLKFQENGQIVEAVFQVREI